MQDSVIYLASDHAGCVLKGLVYAHLEVIGHKLIDLGTDGNVSVDYPDFGFALADALGKNEADAGVLVCGSGIGISIAANRHPKIRAALVHDALGAKMCRLHNDANVICFGGRMIGEEVAKDCLNIFLETDFEGGRHARRVDKLKRSN